MRCGSQAIIILASIAVGFDDSFCFKRNHRHLPTEVAGGARKLKARNELAFTSRAIAIAPRQI